MAPPTASISAPPLSSTSRVRNHSRKKANDDAPYAGPSSAGAKRQAVDKPDSEPRVKRKRVDELPMLFTSPAVPRRPEGESHTSLMDFAALPPSALHRYLVHHDLIPHVHPSPLTAQDPPPPASLLLPRRRSPSPVVTAANRPQRQSREQSRRRSSRLLEEESRGRTPILADIADVHGALAAVAQRHFDAQVVKELLAGFVY
ncbi:hypothetical protein OF83DRAFT_1178003 [Amylostereum chailletii]|nr:hypothetical protein OF83DRAFT_1178003 [Amylostereum chailletii]